MPHPIKNWTRNKIYIPHLLTKTEKPEQVFNEVAKAGLLDYITMRAVACKILFHCL